MSVSNDLNEFVTNRDHFAVEWRGAHFVGFAMRDKSGVPTLVLGSIVCITDGTVLPRIPEGRFVDTPAAVALSARIPEGSLPGVLSDLARDCVPALLREGFGRDVALPFGDTATPAGWHVAFGARYGGQPRVYAQRNASEDLPKLFGYEWLERARSLLLSTHCGPAFNGLADLAAQLPLESSHGFSNSSGRPQFEVVARIPIRMCDFKYDKVARGYRADLELGTSVDQASGLISFVPGARTHLSFSECEEVRRRSDVRSVRAIFPGPPLNEKVTAAVIYCDEILFESTLEPTSTVRMRLAPSSQGEEWLRTLEDTFDRSGRELRVQVRELAGRALPAVLERMQEAVEFLEARPFYSIIATASVVEALLRLRLKRYGASRVNQRLLAAGLRKLTRPPGRVHLAEAIDAAQTLGVIAPVESHAATVMRESRNFVHLELGARGHPRYSEAEAIEAFLAMLRVMDSLGRKRPRRPRAMPSSASAMGGRTRMP